MTRLCALIVALIVAGAGGVPLGRALGAPADAPPGSDDTARARAHFERGRALYDERHFRDAIAEWKQGYALVPRPQFLINIGQAHRQLSELEQAQAYYREFLVTAESTDPVRPQIELLMRGIDELMRARATAATTERAAAPAGAATTLTAPAVAPAPKHSFMRRHWWLVPVSAVVLAGIGVGVYYGVRGAGTAECTASLGCLEGGR